MAFCPNCGSQLPEGSNHCPNCGAPVTPPAGGQTDNTQYQQQEPFSPADNQQSYSQYNQQPYSQYNQPYTQAPLPQVPTGGLMAWAIITLLLCTIPGIVAIVKVSGINKCTTVEEQQNKIKSAKIWCTVGTILGILAVIGQIASRAYGLML